MVPISSGSYEFVRVRTRNDCISLPSVLFSLVRFIQLRRSAPKEGDNVTAARDPGRVMAMQYSRLATSLTSLAIILPIHPHLPSLASTFASVSYTYHTYAYEAERRRKWPYSTSLHDRPPLASSL